MAMIIATAGHVDHGKTSLIKALTGTDTTHLPEERKRGMTIDLGFAGMGLPDGSFIGFVDVPGHERFVRNMLAGVTGVDLALLVVAADDGIMPQTREHLEILNLLQITEGAVALTKTDCVDAARERTVTAAIAALLIDTRWAAAPIFPVSALRGTGIDELRTHLVSRAPQVAAERHGAQLRLPIDRSFTREGAGIIVTGTIVSGRVAVGDRLVLVPGGEAVRVRGIQTHQNAADTLGAGQRCALNIVAPDLDRSRLERGKWIVAPALNVATQHVDARLTLAAAQRLKDGARIQMSHGAGSVGGRLVLLSRADGFTYVQLVLDEPVHALARDAFILRHAGGLKTLAGGRVLDPFPAVRGRRRPERIALLAALDRTDATTALKQLLAIATAGVDLERFAQAWNIRLEGRDFLWSSVGLVQFEGAAYDASRWSHGRELLVAEVARFHTAHPDSYGPSAAQLLRLNGLPGGVSYAQALLQSLLSDKQLLRDGAQVRRPQHEITLSAAERVLWRQIAPLLGPERRPMTVHDIASHQKLDHHLVHRVLQRASRAHHVVRITSGRFLHMSAFRAHAVQVSALAAASAGGLFDAAAFRNMSGLGRGVSIELLEYFDRIGFTQRVGDQRRILGAVPVL